MPGSLIACWIDKPFGIPVISIACAFRLGDTPVTLIPGFLFQAMTKLVDIRLYRPIVGATKLRAHVVVRLTSRAAIYIHGMAVHLIVFSAGNSCAKS